MRRNDVFFSGILWEFGTIHKNVHLECVPTTISRYRQPDVRVQREIEGKKKTKTELPLFMEIVMKCCDLILKVRAR